MSRAYSWDDVVFLFTMRDVGQCFANDKEL